MIDEARKMETYEQLLYRALGGREIAVALSRRADGESVPVIASSMQVPRCTLYRRLDAAEATLKELGLWPESWNSISRKRPSHQAVAA